MFRVKRYVVRGLSSRTDGRLTVTSVMPYMGRDESTVSNPAMAGPIPWKHYAKARSQRSARRASVKAHDAYVAAELALCGPGRFVSSGAMCRTDAGF